MKFLITGASSVLSGKLVALLLKKGGFSFRVLEHNSGVKIKYCETFSGDMGDPESLDRACQGMDGIIHLAALTHSFDEADYFRVNVVGTQNLINSCKKNSVRRFIFVGSTAASPDGGAYGLSKLESENLVCESGLDWLVLRPSEVYGPETGEGIGTLISWIRGSKFIPVIGDGSYFMSPVYIEDVVEAMSRLVKSNELVNKKLNLCGPEKIIFNEVIDRLSRYLKLRRYKVFIPIWAAKRVVSLSTFLGMGGITPDQIPRLLCEKDQNISQTSSLISYNPRNLEAGLKEYIGKEN